MKSQEDDVSGEAPALMREKEQLHTWKSVSLLLRAMLMVKVEESWWGLKYACLSGVYFTTKFITA